MLGSKKAAVFSCGFFILAGVTRRGWVKNQFRRKVMRAFVIS